MSQPPLKPLEIEDLLNQYRSDLRKLEYQIHKTQTVIQELEAQAAEAEEALSREEAKALPSAKKAKAPAKTRKGKRGPGRPPKAQAAASPKPDTQEETTEETKTPETKARGRKGSAGKKATGKKRGPGRPPKSKSAESSPKTTKKERSEKKGAGYRLSEWDQFVINSLKEKQQAMITQDFLDIAKAAPDIKSGEAQIKVKLNRSLHKLANKKEALVKVEHPGRGYAYAMKEWLNNKGELPKKFAR
ncbi:MAG: hypothetical protein H6560_29305 [Lewinellaceae bacterium]|nr:hypothetical protein [Lewinellaceae bacterium]